MTDAEILRPEHIKAGDTLPNLRVKLLDGGDPFNLSGYTVTMRMKKAEAESANIDSAISIDDESRGIVTYDWSAGDTDTSGTYIMEFIADDGSDTMTFPNSGYTTMYVEEGI